MLDQLASSLGYALSIARYLRHTLDYPESRALVQHQLAERERSFLSLVERVIFGGDPNPYGALLAHAGFTFADVTRMVQTSGLEGALSQLYEAGVYLTVEEFKGRRPIRRDGFELSTTARDFDNPLLSSHYEARSSGSRGSSSRVLIDFNHQAQEAAYLLCWLHAHGFADRPIGVWRPAPPAGNGLNGVLRFTKVGRSPQKWFSTSRPEGNREGLRARAFINLTLVISRLVGRALPRPEFVPQVDVLKVARWLAQKGLEGAPAVIECNTSPATRVALAAREHGMDISGTVFQVVGEPLTAAKAEVFASVGARAINRYAMAELSNVGLSCADPGGEDDFHLLAGKVALIVREQGVGQAASVPALLLTSLTDNTPKLMLNVQVGDYATVAERTCGCELGELGLSTHLSRLASYDKLTSEGVNFLGSDLFQLLDEVLPQRFGGSATDYQLVEEEEQGLPRVSLVVAPRVGPLDEGAVVSAVLDAFASYPGGTLMADSWRKAGTLRVLRREPYMTSSSKILPLHVITGR